MKTQSIRQIKRPVKNPVYGYEVSISSIRRAEKELKADLKCNETKMNKSASIAARQYMGRND